MNTATADMTPKEARHLLGLHNRAQFWRVIYTRRVAHIRYTARCIRFPREAIEDLRRSLMVASPEEVGRLDDGRRNLRGEQKGLDV